MTNLLKDKLQELLNIAESENVREAYNYADSYARGIHSEPLFEIVFPVIDPIVQNLFHMPELVRDLQRQSEQGIIDASVFNTVVDGLNNMASRMRDPLVKLEEELPRHLTGEPLQKHQEALEVFKKIAVDARRLAKELNDVSPPERAIIRP